MCLHLVSNMSINALHCEMINKYSSSEINYLIPVSHDDISQNIAISLDFVLTSGIT